ncbi:hypothetical protein HK405_006750, partial [Cladochytrium tenue]
LSPVFGDLSQISLEYETIRLYLDQHPGSQGGTGAPMRREMGIEKMARLTRLEFFDLSTNVCAEMKRRQLNASDARDYLQTRSPAGHKLAALPWLKLIELAGDVFHEIERRFPSTVVQFESKHGGPSKHVIDTPKLLWKIPDDSWTDDLLASISPSAPPLVTVSAPQATTSAPIRDKIYQKFDIFRSDERSFALFGLDKSGRLDIETFLTNDELWDVAKSSLPRLKAFIFIVNLNLQISRRDADAALHAAYGQHTGALSSGISDLRHSDLTLKNASPNETDDRVLAYKAEDAPRSASPSSTAGIPAINTAVAGIKLESSRQGLDHNSLSLPAPPRRDRGRRLRTASSSRTRDERSSSYSRTTAVVSISATEPIKPSHKSPSNTTTAQAPADDGSSSTLLLAAARTWTSSAEKLKTVLSAVPEPVAMVITALVDLLTLVAKAYCKLETNKESAARLGTTCAMLGSSLQQLFLISPDAALMPSIRSLLGTLVQANDYVVTLLARSQPPASKFKKQWNDAVVLADVNAVSAKLDGYANDIKDRLLFAFMDCHIMLHKENQAKLDAQHEAVMTSISALHEAFKDSLIEAANELKNRLWS